MRATSLASIALFGGLCSAGMLQRCYPFKSKGQLEVIVHGTTSILSYPISSAIHNSTIPRYVDSTVMEKPDSGLSVCTYEKYESDQCQGKGLWEFIYNTTKQGSFESTILGGTEQNATLMVEAPGVHCLLFYRDSDLFSDIQIKEQDEYGFDKVATNRSKDIVFRGFTLLSLFLVFWILFTRVNRNPTTEIYDAITGESIFEPCYKGDDDFPLTRPISYYFQSIQLGTLMPKFMVLVGIDELCPFLPDFITHVATLIVVWVLVKTYSPIYRQWRSTGLTNPADHADWRRGIRIHLWIHFLMGFLKATEHLFRFLSPGSVNGALMTVADWVCCFAYPLCMYEIYVYVFEVQWICTRRGFSPLRRRCFRLTREIIFYVPIAVYASSIVGQLIIHTYQYPQGGIYIYVGSIEYSLFTVGWSNGAFEYDTNPGILLQLFLYLPSVIQDITILACYIVWRPLYSTRLRIWTKEVYDLVTVPLNS